VSELRDLMLTGKNQSQADQPNSLAAHVILNLISPVHKAIHDREQCVTSSQPPQADDWLTIVTLPEFQTLPEVTCVYGIDNKCSGTITPQRLSILQDACNSARHQGFPPC